MTQIVHTNTVISWYELTADHSPSTGQLDPLCHPLAVTCCVNYLYSQWSVGACDWHGWMMPWPDCPPLYLAICGRLIRRWSKGEVLTRPNLCYKWYYCSIFTSSVLELHNYINMHFHYFLYRPFAISYILLQYWKDCWGVNTMLQSCHYHLNRSHSAWWHDLRVRSSKRLCLYAASVALYCSCFVGQSKLHYLHLGTLHS